MEVNVRIARTRPRLLRAQRRVTSREKVNSLFDLAVTKARTTGDSRLETLLKAPAHQREQVLRSLGILTEVDIEREFGS